MSTRSAQRTSLACGRFNKQGDVWTAPNGELWGIRAIIDKQRRRPDETRYPDSAMWGTRLNEYSVEVQSYSAKRIAGRIRKFKIDSPLPCHPRCYVFHLGDATEVNERCAGLLDSKHQSDRARMRKLHQQDRKKRDKDGDWYSLRHAALYMGGQKHQSRWKTRLQRWKSDDCPLLGRPINTRPFETWRGRFEDYISKKDLDDIRTAMKRLKAEPAEEETTSRTQTIAAIGACEATVNKLLSKAEEAAKIVQTGKRSDGRPAKLTRIKNSVIEKIIKYRKQPTIPEAAAILGVSRIVVDKLIEKNVLTPLPDPFGYQRYKRLDRKEVERVKAQRENEENQISTDKRGRWLPPALAQKRYSNATQKILYKYANKPCPQLGGDVLHMDYFMPDVGMPQRGKSRGDGVQKFLEEDLKRLKRPRIGMPGQWAARAARQRAECNAVDTPRHGTGITEPAGPEQEIVGSGHAKPVPSAAQRTTQATEPIQHDQRHPVKDERSHELLAEIRDELRGRTGRPHAASDLAADGVGAVAAREATNIPPFQSASDLARRLGQPIDTVETFLRRHRERFPDCFREAEGRRRNEPRYLYRVADVWPALRDHFDTARRHEMTDG